MRHYSSFLQKFLLSTVSYITLLNNVINFCFLFGEHLLTIWIICQHDIQLFTLLFSAPFFFFCSRLNKFFLHNINFRNVDLWIYWFVYLVFIGLKDNQFLCFYLQVASVTFDLLLLLVLGSYLIVLFSFLIITTRVFTPFLWMQIDFVLIFLFFLQFTSLVY